MSSQPPGLGKSIPLSEKLAQALEALKALQDQGKIAIRSADLSKSHRELLSRNGFLQTVMKGWYVPSRPDERPGDSTPWFVSFWPFCRDYLKERFGVDWCLSPEQSVSLHAGNRNVPVQLIVRAPNGSNRVIRLPYNTSILDMRLSLPSFQDWTNQDGLQIFTLPAALIHCSSTYFQNNPTDVQAALMAIRDASELLERLLEGGHSSIAGRLAGAFQNMGRYGIANDIVGTMKAAGYDVRISDPFSSKLSSDIYSHPRSPYVNRVKLMWHAMRKIIPPHFPEPPGIPENVEDYLKQVEELYVTDAYHSLSIEGYQVSPELIQRVRLGSWNPDVDPSDKEHRNALAARGYWQAYQSVQTSIRRILSTEASSTVIREDHGAWYRELFAPSVTVGLLKLTDLAGYRTSQVYIRGSMHVPPNPNAIRDLMPAFFELLEEEKHPAVRAVLGHFLFVYIHPYMDGNGRIGRFLMNALLASGGYPWTVIPMNQRAVYLQSLEKASVHQDIQPFCDLLATLVQNTMMGRPSAASP